MKPLLPALALLAVSGLTLLHADDVALMEIRVEKEKLPHQVAIEFYPDAPATVANFKKLADKKFFNGQTFHRIFPHILVQAGDPLSRGKNRSYVGTGGPGYTLLPEIHRKHTLGAVSAARLPDKINPSRVSNGSQFFVCLKPMPEYDGQYTVFGHVFAGLDTLDAISTMAVDTNDDPIERITIKSLRILPREKLPATVVPPVPVAPVKPAPAKSAPAKKAAANPAPAQPAAATPAPAQPAAKKSWWKIF